MFNIEIQLSDEADYDKRALFYWAKLYTEQLQKSLDYSNLSKAIGIHILNFISITSNDNYHNVFHIRENRGHLSCFEGLELHTIELKKFSQGGHEELQDLIAKIHTSLDVWAAFLTRHDLMNKDKLPKVLDTPSLKKALTVLDEMNFAYEERQDYEDHLKWLRFETAALKKAALEAQEKGREEGIKEGKRRAAIEFIQEMLNRGYSEDQIKLMTGYSVQDVRD